MPVLGKGDKERIVPIPDGAIALLKGYRDVVRPVFLKGRSNLFFVNRFGRKITSNMSKTCWPVNAMN